MAKGRAILIELWNRVTDYKPQDKVYFNGEYNMYPNEMERVVMNSPTATRARGLMSRTILANGIANDTIISKKTNEKLSDIVKDVCDDVSLQYGSWIHVSYGINSEGKLAPKSPRTLDYNKCRKDKPDDDDNLGKIIYKDFTKKSFGGKKDKGKWFYPFTRDEKVIIQQIKSDASELIKQAQKEGREITIADMLPLYRGQVYYLNLTPKFTYAISRFDSVYNDCDTEYRMSVYSNTMTREGFLGKTAVVTSGLDPTSSEQVKKDIQNWLGSENSGNVYYLEVESVETLDNVLKIVSVDSQYDDNMFQNTEKRIRRNILGAANNAPEGLVFSNDNAGLFSGSGEQYIQMKKFYFEQTEYERKKIEETFELIGFPIEIIPFKEEVKEEIPVRY